MAIALARGAGHVAADVGHVAVVCGVECHKVGAGCGLVDGFHEVDFAVGGPVVGAGAVGLGVLCNYGLEV